ncbi:tRNA (adenosine(37)-N6)-threonylcarbamoyltransferase complex dimerization subunit type 1 TsaB [Blochmannia endosymbiont of Camponotus sp.]|uniref:tRNA (adenosine(37)-N6)-threonylcarbamoyltransferase complex dimerization subunit type 1 TsaB n=1 Tax=Blochmannia endosymbiont of Camponotus sp. TaxID=700220 RepID=UPI002024CC5D|nr:tRNA (adenosine(37)-N6)-threonylcarbamoyltransferase complex dimerization subunit type 1 TsaB [Blochmannia endosymbiont of Camponotus sp.]URJ29951.1 tRNA (adenosine(37)-N6)-threonylcarbamoyltransferase complex dimerization subunit type 1 TsaB [Blochmannia endosymbiont of Camponotus sp.]
MSTRILAFDTTTELCSVALMIDHNIYDHKIVASRRHAEKILPMINKLLVEVGVTLRSLDCIIFNRGPGGFVGIRIGICVAQGLALGADLPLVEVSSLAVLAQGAWRIFSIKQVISTIDARMGELYCARYCRMSDNNCWICDSSESIMTAEVIAAELMCNTMLKGSWVLAGTGWNNYLVLENVKVNDTVFLRKIVMSPEAQDMLLLGMQSWRHKIFLTPNQAQPVYLRNKIVST